MKTGEKKFSVLNLFIREEYSLSSLAVNGD